MKRDARKLLFSGLVLGGWLAGSQARAQEGDDASRPQEFGLRDEVYNLGPSDFQVGLAEWPAGALNELFWRVASGSESVLLLAPVHLPAGARISKITVFYYDTHPDSDPHGALWRVNQDGGGAFAFVAFPDFSGGYNSVNTTPSSDLTVDNQHYHYLMRIVLRRSTGNDSQEQFLNYVRIQYRRQVSPAPDTARFTDVPVSHPFFQFVEAVFASGITAGCQASPRMFCPDRPITRGEMAVFMAKALGLHWGISSGIGGEEP